MAGLFVIRNYRCKVGELAKGTVVKSRYDVVWRVVAREGVLLRMNCQCMVEKGYILF